MSVSPHCTKPLRIYWSPKFNFKLDLTEAQSRFIFLMFPYLLTWDSLAYRNRQSSKTKCKSTKPDSFLIDVTLGWPTHINSPFILMKLLVKLPPPPQAKYRFVRSSWDEWQVSKMWRGTFPIHNHQIPIAGIKGLHVHAYTFSVSWVSPCIVPPKWLTQLNRMFVTTKNGKRDLVLQFKQCEVLLFELGDVKKTMTNLFSAVWVYDPVLTTLR